MVEAESGDGLEEGRLRIDGVVETWVSADPEEKVQSNKAGSQEGGDMERRLVGTWVAATRRCLMEAKNRTIVEKYGGTAPSN